LIKLRTKINGFNVDYREIFNKFPSSIILLDINGFILDLNSSMKKLFGYNKNELIGKNIKSFPRLSTNSIEIIGEKSRKLLKNEFVKPFDLKIHKKDGVEIWVNVEALLINIDEISVILLEVKDISKYKTMETKLKEINQSQDDFVNFATHELKTPLSSVYGACQLLKDLCKEELSEKALEYVEIALSAGKRLKFLMFNLFDSAKIDSGRFFITPKRENLIDIIEEGLNDMVYLFREKNIKLLKDLPPELYLNVDKSKIEQVVINLLSNAVKFTPSNGTIKIMVKRNQKEFAKVSIADTGIGLTKREISQLFKKFSRTKRSTEKVKNQSMEGTGLGLYLSKKIIELHNGKIWVQSKGKNKGSTFTFTLPLDK